jgi:multiple sugar transport system permease protein
MPNRFAPTLYQSQPKKPWLTRGRRRAITGILLVLPWIIGFIIFTAGPMLASLILSFFRYNLIAAPVFTGLENFTYIFTKDPLFWDSVRRTVVWAVSVVIIGVSISLLLALLINSKVNGNSFFRIAFFVPTLTPLVAGVLLWRWILQPTYGPVNSILGLLGIQGPGWLLDPNWSVSALVIIYLWLTVGGANLIIFLAGLKGIPVELYDAAKVDGANAWDVFTNLTLPLLSPTLFYVLVIGMIGGLRVFTLPFIISTDPWQVGGPEESTYFYLIHIYQNAFKYNDMGIAMALGWVFFLAVIFLTIFQFVGSKYWVYYEAEE